MGNTCSCCSNREQRIEELLDDSLEDKLLGKRDDDVEITMAEEEAWRQRRQELKDEADMSMRSIDEDIKGSKSLRDDSHESIWDIKDRSTIRTAHNQAVEAVEDEEDEEAFGSAKEDTSDYEVSTADDDGDEASPEFGTEGEDFHGYRLTQETGRDSYASMNDYDREEGSRVFRDTELESTNVSDSFVASNSYRDTESLVEYDTLETQEEQHEEQQTMEHQSDQVEDEINDVVSSSSSSRRRSNKKKARNRKSARK